MVVDIPGDHIAFGCFANQYTRGTDGSVLAICVEDEESNVCLVKIDKGFNKKILQDFGHWNNDPGMDDQQ